MQYTDHEMKEVETPISQQKFNQELLLILHVVIFH
jgi:hypothetical protein